MGGVCNSCVDPANAAVITQCGGIPLVVQCLSSPVRNTVNYALGALYYLCNKSNSEEILKPEVIDVIERYAEAQTVNVSFSNLAKAFLDKHAFPRVRPRCKIRITSTSSSPSPYSVALPCLALPGTLIDANSPASWCRACRVYSFSSFLVASPIKDSNDLAAPGVGPL
ncbi:ribose 5-phosphate isomerase family protein [Hibiscus syriacus]|uniref:Ribose 5-phosphate isomerase family protein n=1 Tax=Hibiscus syriacus TaxID=106335 RepID=A0A6A2Z8C4_HIBSY|nr:ribose 5-phosphate isomerase family protein [Hibiscus syriacus]